MELSERLFLTMKEKKITQEKLANVLEIRQSTVASWKKRGIMPPAEYITKICELLNISYDYMFTGQEKQDFFTGEERELVEQFRATDDTGKKRIMEYVQDMRRLHPEQEREPETEAKIS